MARVAASNPQRPSAADAARTQPHAATVRGSPSSRRRRRLCIALAIYGLLTIAVFAMAQRERLLAHSPYNHYALLADAWLQGRLDLGGPPPAYTGNNDFAVFQGKTYISFPPFPAVLLVPIVAAAGSVERVRDAQFFFWLAGLGPALLFLVLERLRQLGRTARREWENAALAVLFGLGTVYWFTAAQGTVWFAAHVVGVALLVLYLWCSIGARHPAAAGVVLGLAFATRPTLALALPFFLYEALQAARQVRASGAAGPLGSVLGADTQDLLRRLAWFAVPAAAVLFVVLWHNQARFGDLWEFGHRHLQVAWRRRIDRWGLFSYHYLGRNLSVVLAGLPFYGPRTGVQINGHGLALWLTTPLYLWALSPGPRRTSPLFAVCALSAACVAAPALLYQNTGWIQFGYRFSNDFAPLLFLMIALGHRRWGSGFWTAAACCVAINAFGAWTFGKDAHRHFYFIDNTQKVLHQPD